MPGLMALLQEKKQKRGWNFAIEKHMFQMRSANGLFV